MSLYNELRPKTLKEIVGQEKTVEILANELSKGIVHNAYLLVGERGTGKTTIARILAKSFNCENPADGCGCGNCPACKEIAAGSSMDVYELDAASNNGVDNIRDILEKVQFKPIRRKKVFILDEVHMLSNAASNALLKVLEEPPADVVFILATTERQKVLPTIKSRCATYEFEKIPKGLIESYMKKICEDKGVPAEDAALGIIAKAARGGMRDALSMLDQFLSKEKIEAKDVAETLGMTTEESIFSLLNAYAKKSVDAVVSSVRELSAKGVSMAYLIEVMCDVLLDAVCLRMTGSASDIVGTEDYVNGVAELAQELDEDRAFRLLDDLREIYRNRAAGVESALMGALVHISTEDVRLANLEQRVSALESRPATVATQAEASSETLDPNATTYIAEAIINRAEAGEAAEKVAKQVASVEAEQETEVSGLGDADSSEAPADDGFSALTDDIEFDCPFDEEPVDFGSVGGESDPMPAQEEPAVETTSETPSETLDPNATTHITEEIINRAEAKEAAEKTAKQEKTDPKPKVEPKAVETKSISFDDLQAKLDGESGKSEQPAETETVNSEPEMEIFSGFARLFGTS